MANNYSPTDVNAVTTTNFNLADVIVYDYDYGQNGVIGWVNCPAEAAVSGSHPNRTCVGQTLKFNTTIANAYNTLNKRRFEACHEFGHTLGLRHPDDNTANTCLITGIHDITVLRQHDRDHLNAQY